MKKRPQRRSFCHGHLQTPAAQSMASFRTAVFGSARILGIGTNLGLTVRMTCPANQIILSLLLGLFCSGMPTESAPMMITGTESTVLHGGVPLRFSLQRRVPQSGTLL
ncbi:MAG: hypothetical protein C0P67_015045, partial [Bacillota bacterium]